VKVKWLGHACFLITSDAGIKIITDPFTSGGGISYPEIKEAADVVLTSHEHGDHSNTAAIKGKPQIIKGTGVTETKGIKFKGIGTYHDDAKGTKRGKNTVFVFEVDGIRICHLGDLGHDLSDAEVGEIGKVDVLFIPVGGFYTCDVPVAKTICNKLSPKVAIPMHFKTPKLDTSVFGAIVGCDEFLTGKTNVDRRNSNEIEFRVGQLPVSTQIVVLMPP